MQEYSPKNGEEISENIIEVIKALKHSNGKIKLAKKVKFAIASGEPALYPGLEKIISETPDAYFEILTNASIYSKVIERLISGNRGEILVSLDSGTAETFKTIKGLDLFERVINNIRKYRDHGNVLLKYIVIPGVNDNMDDIDGFIRICRNIDPKKIYVARDCIYDFDIKSISYGELTMSFMRRLIDNIKKLDIEYELLYFPNGFEEELENS